MKRLLAAVIAAMALTVIPAVPSVAKDAPRNDEFSRAKKVTSLPFSKTVDVTDATQAADDPSCRDTGHTVWYKFTPGADMRLIARVRGRKTAEWISVWTGTKGSLTDVVCGDYRPIFEATAGTTYYFMVGTYRNRRGGEIQFTLREAPPPPTIEVTVDPEVIVNPQTEQVTVSGTIACTNSEYMEFYGSVRQINDDRRFISAFFYGYDEECSETPQPWTATELGDGVFLEGPGLLEFEAYTCSRIECVEYETVSNVTIRRASI